MQSAGRLTLSLTFLGLSCGALCPQVLAQDASLAPATASVVVPHLVQYGGALGEVSAQPVTLRFALYAAQSGGEPVWSETQKVTLDAKGRYSVLLGSTTSEGLPQSVFSSGEAKWLGVSLGNEPEQARTVLVATPYSLKASDAETLGGHPVADFKLAPKDANGTPEAGTDITQINVSSGILGGGTGPTVALKLDPTYFQQLAASFVTGISASSGIIAVRSGSTYTLTLSTPYFQQLAANFAFKNGAQTFTGLQTFNTGISAIGSGTLVNASTSSAATFALIGRSTQTGDGWGIGAYATQFPLFGQATDTTSTDTAVGVEGETLNTGVLSAGVTGEAPNGAGASGVYGVTNSYGPSSVEGTFAVTNFGSGGVWGDITTVTNGNGAGILGTADDNNGAILANNSPTGYYTLYIRNDDTTSAAYPFEAYNSNTGTGCSIDFNANLFCDGTIGAVTGVGGRKVASYSMQSAENWMEDFGTGQLTAGSGHVSLEPGFAALANTGVEYHVFLTPRGDSKGLFIASQSGDSFEVRESQGGKSDLSFDYRIVAKHKGMESKRLEDVTARMSNGPRAGVHYTQPKARVATAARRGANPADYRPGMVSTAPVRK